MRAVSDGNGGRLIDIDVGSNGKLAVAGGVGWIDQDLDSERRIQYSSATSCLWCMSQCPISRFFEMCLYLYLFKPNPNQNSSEFLSTSTSVARPLISLLKTRHRSYLGAWIRDHQLVQFVEQAPSCKWNQGHNWGALCKWIRNQQLVQSVEQAWHKWFGTLTLCYVHANLELAYRVLPWPYFPPQVQTVISKYGKLCK